MDKICRDNPAFNNQYGVQQKEEHKVINIPSNSYSQLPQNNEEQRQFLAGYLKLP